MFALDCISAVLVFLAIVVAGDSWTSIALTGALILGAHIIQEVSIRRRKRK